MPFADITNKSNPAGTLGLPTAPKKPAASLACIANGNLRSRRSAAPAKDKTDECMQDASAIMSIASAVKEKVSGSDVSMASNNPSGDTTVTMRHPTANEGTGGKNSGAKSEESAGYTEMLLEETSVQLIDNLRLVQKSHSCADTKRLIDTAIGLDRASIYYRGVERLEYRDTSTRNISRVIGKGAFKMVLEDNGKALAVYLKDDGDMADSTRKELLVLQEILTSVLLSSHRDSMPNFLLVDGIFRTKTCRRFFPEDTVAFRMELCNAVLDDVLADAYLSLGLNKTTGLARLSLKQIDGLFFQLCCALAYMHDVLDIYHLDLKPTNLLLTSLRDAKSEVSTFRYQLGTKQFSMSLPRSLALVKIADLGSSMPDVKSYFHTTSGTLSYRPPEYHLQGVTGQAGSCTDIFAVGLMMLEAYLGMSHDDFIEERLVFSEGLEDFLFEHIEEYRLCQLVYGYFVLFSNEKDIELYRRTSKLEEGWPIDAGDVTKTFVSLLAEDPKFYWDWRFYSIRSGSDNSIVQLRMKICGADTIGSHQRLDAFLSMLRIDPSKRSTAAELATSPLFEHLEVTGQNGGANSNAGEVICRLGEEIFA